MEVKDLINKTDTVPTLEQDSAALVISTAESEGGTLISTRFYDNPGDDNELSHASVYIRGLASQLIADPNLVLQKFQEWVNSMIVDQKATEVSEETKAKTEEKKEEKKDDNEKSDEATDAS